MFQEIISQVREFNSGQILELLSNCIEILRNESQKGQGKLKNKISQVKERESFTDQNIIFLPACGVATFVGDLHGDLNILKKILTATEDDLLIFLGDYVDRGDYQLETINTLLVAKLKYPKKVFLLRGNHESLEMNQVYGFIDELAQKFPQNFEIIYQNYLTLYEVLPSVLIAGNGIIALHGGIPNELPKGLLDLNSYLKKLYQTRWNDPDPDISGFGLNLRGGETKIFGQDVFEEFIKLVGGKVMITSHRCVKEGYELIFNNKFMTIFSTSYGGLAKPCYLKINLQELIKEFKKEMVFSIS